jgi:hypothetical protein
LAKPGGKELLDWKQQQQQPKRKKEEEGEELS